MKSNAKCPVCGKQISLRQNNKWRPFCTERCRLIDLGAWIDGSNSIPGDEFISQEPGEDVVETKH